LHKFLPTLFLCLSVASGPLAADDQATNNDELPNWGECRVPSPPPFVLPADDVPEDELAIFSGKAEIGLAGNANFSDDISLVSGNRLLTAEDATYDRQSGLFTVEGRVEFRDPQTIVRADRAELNQYSQEVRFDGAEFQLWSVPARGRSEHINAERGGKLRLSKVSYTTCPEGNDDWLLKASKIRIDRKLGIGTANNARLEFKGVPFLYLPYISYPVTDQRKSGWLIPKLGTSQQRGVDIEVPYYWNIAPQYDATITPRYMSRRGFQLKPEFRYLTGHNNGIMFGEILPDDNETDRHRALAAWRHMTNFTRDARMVIDAIHVSDSAYFEDLSSGLSSTSQTHLRRRTDFEYFDDTWSGLLRFEDYQTIDDTIAAVDRPYTALPRLGIRGHTPNGWLGLQYTLDGEATYFDRDVGVTGLRTHLRPEIAWSRRLYFVEVEPSFAVDYAGYQLNDTAPTDDDHPSRMAPIYSIDAHTVFERLTPRRGWPQTLEPRALYTYIPFTKQSDLPVFDTIEPDLNVVQLFRKNRYVGPDRLGDTNQLSLGITTRLIDADNGDEFLNATIGQILYFSNRDITLPNGTPSDSNTSDYLFELGTNFYKNWRMQLGYQYNSDTRKTKKTEVRLNYRSDDSKLVNVSYRFRRGSLKEIDLSAAWPIAEHWNLVGRYDYSILDHKLLERFAGIEYDTCCWSIRGIWRRSLTKRTGESDTSFSIQLQLKGLGNNTSAADRWLDRGILDYD